MILIYGRIDDPPLAHTVGALQETGATCVILEQGALDREGLQIEVGPGGIEGDCRCGRAGNFPG